MNSKNLDIYGAEELPWSRVLEQLESADNRATYWLATTRPDGRPHIAGVGALWDGGKVYFVSGPNTRKSQNLAGNDRCAIAVSLRDVDLVIEGTAAKVKDEATLVRLVGRYVEGGWPAEARDGSITAPYSAPSAGPAPWDLYVLTPTRAIAVATAEPSGATRWRLG